MAGLGPCPFAGQMLADLGARVILIERNAHRDFTGTVNRRGKLSICLDLKSASGREIVLRLAGKSDVLIEGYRPGVMERLGLGPTDLLAANPRIVYGRMTGWGQEGPLAQSAGHDITYLAITGALHAMGEPGRPPVPPLNLVADYGGGSMMLLTGVLAALIERARTGAGQVVDAAMVDGVPAMMGLV
ncbi:MAG TPA: CaiB/BaiF CoA-transferase family protein, partial [Rhizobiaceae bacterium]|nr:CaiB/BaiF CoA-transferase family protein [Rhizobiaceae bacterium]